MNDINSIIGVVCIAFFLVRGALRLIEHFERSRDQRRETGSLKE